MYTHPLSTDARPLKDHWETTKFDRSLNGLSVSTQWSPMSSMISLSDLSVNAIVGMVSIKFLTGSKQSLSGLWGKRAFTERSKNSQRALNGLTSLSMISRQSADKRNSFGEISWLLSELRWSQLVSQRSQLVSERAPLIAQWALNELSMVAIESTKTERSPRSLRDLRW